MLYSKANETRVKLLEIYDAPNRNLEKETEYEKLFSSQLTVYNMGCRKVVNLQKEIRDKYKEIKERMGRKIDSCISVTIKAR